jgi:hypothetical protein
VERMADRYVCTPATAATGRASSGRRLASARVSCPFRRPAPRIKGKLLIGAKAANGLPATTPPGKGNTLLSASCTDILNSVTKRLFARHPDPAHSPAKTAETNPDYVPVLRRNLRDEMIRRSDINRCPFDMLLPELSVS